MYNVIIYLDIYYIWAYSKINVSRKNKTINKASVCTLSMLETKILATPHASTWHEYEMILQ